MIHHRMRLTSVHYVGQFVVAILAGVLLGIFTFQSLCKQTFGKSVWKTDGVSVGYVLTAPFHLEDNYNKPGEVLLINTDGVAAHAWKTKYQTLISYLQPNGHIYAAMTPPIKLTDFPSGGSTGLIQELDWEGNVIWEYADRDMTHDFEVMPDGGVAYIRWHKAPESFGRRVVGGKPGPTPETWTNEIVVLSRDKQVIWTWRPEEHLNPADFPLQALLPRSDWAHFNSIRYIAENPITHVPAFLISSRHLNAVFFIDAKTGGVIWRSPKGVIATQHDATLLENGNVLIFDNGFLKNTQLPFLSSRAVEIDPRTDKVVWQFPGKEWAERILFADSLMSGAQRLTNGNTLITGTTDGEIVEVTSGGKIVWKYRDDFRNADGARLVFKTRKYDPAGTEWGKKVPVQWSGLCRM